MKAAIIGASSESLHAIAEAKALGVTTLALDGNPNAEGLAAADVGMHVDISGEEEVIRVLKEECPDFILPVPIGRFLTTIGAANDALGLKGISKQAAVWCTDKYAFHEKLAGAGLRPIHCVLIPAGETAQTVIDDSRMNISYPLICKPRFGSGSRGICWVKNEADLAALEAVDEEQVLEEILPGDEYGVDGCVIDGKFELILLRRKLNTPPPARQAVGYLSVVPEEEPKLWQAVYSYMKSVAEVIGMNDCLLHADLMIVEGDAVVEAAVAEAADETEAADVSVGAIEVSARPSGHNLHNLFTPMATGVDVCREFVKYQEGMEYSFHPERVRKLMIRYFDLEECTIESVPAKEELPLPADVTCLEWNCAIQPGDYLEKVTGGHSIMGRGYFILEGTDDASLCAAADAVLGAFEVR